MGNTLAEFGRGGIILIEMDRVFVARNLSKTNDIHFHDRTHDTGALSKFEIFKTKCPYHGPTIGKNARKT